MEGSENDEASDTGASGPGAPVADMSAMLDRTTYDDHGYENGHETIQRLDMPLSGYVTCAICTDRGVRESFIDEVQFRNHMETRHPRCRLIWRCTGCEKEYNKLHGWRVHRSRCKGRETGNETEGVEQIKCQLCGDGFQTHRGLAQHERHKHPLQRNTNRQTQSSGRTRLSNRASAWSKEEVDLLIRLDRRYCGEKYPNVKIREFLPQKTLKQISGKRRLLPARGRIEPVAEEDSSSGSSIYVSATEEIDEAPRRSFNGGQWEEPLREAILSNSLGDNHPLRLLERKIQDMATWRQFLQTDVDLLTQSIIEEIRGDVERGPTTRSRTAGVRKRQPGNGKGTQRRKNSRTGAKKYTYARHQEIYKKCPPRLVDWAIAGKQLEAKEKIEAPAKEEVEPLYRDLWGIAGPQVKLKWNRRDRNRESLRMEDVWKPVTDGELIESIKKIKKNTTAGVDNIRKGDLRRDGALHVLAKLYNLLLMSRIYPNQWRANRTTLIPKPGKSVEEVGNWRPITIGSLVGRIYSSMIDRRLRDIVKINRRQKGFTKEDGCKQNVAILSSALSSMKEKEGGVVTIIDVSKAFDTVPHCVMGSCLRAKGVPAVAAQYIEVMYKDNKSIITCKGGDRIETKILRGVRQGDPLSPLIFNIILDPVIGKINETTEGIPMGDEKISVLAFADDLVLMARTKKEAAKQTKKLTNYLKALGMNVAASKCSTFQIVQRSKSWYMVDPEITIGETKIPYTNPEASFKYLGIKVDPWKGLHDTAKHDIIEAVKNIRNFKLKPHQKINLIRTYLLPRFMHTLITSAPPLGTLKQIDQEVRQLVKQILHLHPSTTDGVIYTNKSHGGLGVQRVETIVKLAKLRSALKMKESEDAAVKRALLGQEAILQKYAKSVGLDWVRGTNMNEIEDTRRKLKKKETDAWRQLVSQGQGIREFFGDKIGNKWLYNPELLKPSRYLDALKLRTNTFGTRVALHRANKNRNVMCRRCGVQAETLGHILGNCTHTKPMRIRRHDEICRLIENKMPSHCAVFREPSINVLGELRKPDLVIKDQDTVIVVDVTVRYEDKENLPQAYKEKIHKYTDTAELLRIKLSGVRAEIIPVVVGCRGAMPKKTKENMKRLGLGQNDCLTASLIALRSSLEIANAFIDYDRIGRS